MELTSANSIFRCMPTILPLRFRRLLSAFAYAVDGVELSYSRLRETALQYELPPAGDAQRTARNRVSILTDAWSLIDHVSRARKIVSRFTWDHSKGPAELNRFIGDTKESALIRNRLHRLDEEIQSKAECAEGYTILGTVSWIDARGPSGPIHYVIASGSGEEEAKLATGSNGRSGQISDFKLRVCDQEADLDALHESLLRFSRQLEPAVAISVRDLVFTEAKRRQVPVEQLLESQLADLTVATPLQAAASSQHRLFEVPPNSYAQEIDPVVVNG